MTADSLRTPVAPPVNIQHASLTDVGVKRSHNQDACAAQPAPDDRVFRAQGHVFVVADGMGGHAVGEKASAKAARDIPLTYLKHVGPEGPAAAIRRAFTEANAAIYAVGQNNPEFKGLGTTATMLVLRPEGAWVGHVGDSRAYRIRGGRVQQLTFDHSWVWEVARRQGIDPDELGDFKRNVIIRSLGPDAEVEVDLEGPHPVDPGDAFLLCSDGLTNMVAPDELGAVVAAFPAADACRHLVALANARGGPDNITCQIVKVPGGRGTALRPAAGRRLGAAGRAAAAVGRVVPWPFLALAGGAAAAGLSVWLRAEGLAGAVPAFALAAGLILAGLVGMYRVLARKADDPGAAADGDPADLRLYRDYGVEVGEPLAARFADLAASLAEAAKGQDVAVDWGTYDRHLAEADRAAGKGDWAGAFRARFLAVQAVAAGLTSGRGKGESFRPNWTPSARKLGG